MPSQDFRELLGLQKPTVYRAVRDEIKAYQKEHGIQNRSRSTDADWRGLISWVLHHRYVRSTVQFYLDRGVTEDVEAVRELRKAAHFLCLSCSKVLRAEDKGQDGSDKDQEGLGEDLEGLGDDLEDLGNELEDLGNTLEGLGEELEDLGDGRFPAAAKIAAPTNPVAPTPPQTTGLSTTAPSTPLPPTAPGTPPPPTAPSTPSPPTAPSTPPPPPSTRATAETEVVPPPAVIFSTVKTECRTIRVSLCDSDEYQEAAGDSPWSGNGVIRIYSAFLQDSSYSELMRACGKHIPKGRSLQEILAATGNPVEDSDVVTLTDDEEVKAWLVDTVGVQPLRVLSLLARKPRPPPILVSTQPASLMGGQRTQEV